MTTQARVVFFSLVLATFAAFFVTQRLKHQPTVVQRIQLAPRFSPTGYGGLHRERISFRIKQADAVTVTIVDGAGNTVATLTRARPEPAYSQQSLRWDGVTDAGTPAPDGLYRVRFHLSAQARTVQAPRAFTLASIAPRPLVAVAPQVLAPGARTALNVTLDLAGGHAPTLELYRTDTVPARAVASIPIPRTAVRGAGTLRLSFVASDHGRPLPEGVYAVAATVAGPGGRLGSTPPALPPRAIANATIPGHAGFAVRQVSIAGPAAPVQAGAAADFNLDTHGVPYTWTLARAGSRHALRGGRGHEATLTFNAPGGAPGLYELAVTAAGHSAVAPLAIRASTTSRPPVLVVLPAVAWLDGEAADDDGDGLPDRLAGDRPVSRARGFSRPRLAPDPAPLLGALDADQRPYDVTTDLALADGTAPPLNGYAGIVLAGGADWVAPPVAALLRHWVRAGGNLAALGRDPLRRFVVVSAGAISEPSPPAPMDIFGMRPASPGAASAQRYGAGRVLRIPVLPATPAARATLMENTWRQFSR